MTRSSSPKIATPDIATALQPEEFGMDTAPPEVDFSTELASLIDEPEIRLVMEADHVGREELLAFLTRAQTGRRKRRV